MSKTIGLKALSLKKYIMVEGLPQEILDSIGEIEDSWDGIIYGSSGNGKTNLTCMLLKAVIKSINCRCEYVAYEEGHAKTIKNTMIERHNMLEELGNKLQITDHLTFDELYKRIAKRQSAKIWVIDSIQASRFTADEYKKLKREFVNGKKKKIILCISWAEGKNPQGAVAKGIEYMANIKMRVENFIMFPKSRYGGNKPFVIWEGNNTEGALAKWGKEYWKITGKKKVIKPKAPIEPVNN